MSNKWQKFIKSKSLKEKKEGEIENEIARFEPIVEQDDDDKELQNKKRAQPEPISTTSSEPVQKKSKWVKYIQLQQGDHQNEVAPVSRSDDRVGVTETSIFAAFAPQETPTSSLGGGYSLSSLFASEDAPDIKMAHVDYEVDPEKFVKPKVAAPSKEQLEKKKRRDEQAIQIKAAKERKAKRLEERMQHNVKVRQKKLPKEQLTEMEQISHVGSAAHDDAEDEEGLILHPARQMLLDSKRYNHAEKRRLKAVERAVKIKHLRMASKPLRRTNYVNKLKHADPHTARDYLEMFRDHEGKKPWRFSRVVQNFIIEQSLDFNIFDNDDLLLGYMKTILGKGRQYALLHTRASLTELKKMKAGIAPPKPLENENEQVDKGTAESLAIREHAIWADYQGEKLDLALARAERIITTVEAPPPPSTFDES